MDQQQFILTCLEHGLLVSPEFFEGQHPERLGHSFFDLFKKSKPIQTPSVLTQDIYGSLQEQGAIDINWVEFEKSRVLKEKGRDAGFYHSFLEILQPPPNQLSPENPLPLDTVALVPPVVTVVKTYQEKSSKRDAQDFVTYYKLRYDALSAILKYRPELQNLTSISRLNGKQDRSDISIIGLVYDKRETKNGDLIVTLEDSTGSLPIFFSKSKEIFKQTSTLCFDEVIGVRGVLHRDMLTATHLLYPEIINTKDKHSPTEAYVAFISDIHVGSKYFLEDAFLTFVQWLNGEYGNENQKSLAKNVKYIFVAGDLVDGIGVFPGQEDNLLLHDIKLQYARLAELLSLIKRPDLAIIIAPGNHDATRISQPQPPLHKEYAAKLYELPNTYFVSNPSLVNVHASPQFEGFNILIYHGASFHYYIDTISCLREKKPRDNPCVVHKFLLQKRHLAPSHTATIYTPETTDDPLIVSTVPDVLICGDMHKSDVGVYNGVITINASCWQSKTDFQIKTGNNPDPGKVPLLNLKTREVTMLDFVQSAV